MEGGGNAKGRCDTQFPVREGCRLRIRIHTNGWALGEVLQIRDISGIKSYLIHYVDYSTWEDEWVTEDHLDKNDVDCPQTSPISDVAAEPGSTLSQQQAAGSGGASRASRSSREINPATVDNSMTPDLDQRVPVIAAFARHRSVCLNDEMPTRQQNIRMIELGKYRIRPLYYSPYPEIFEKVPCVYICEFCLKPSKSRRRLARHLAKCGLRHPPGKEIYREERISFFEVDGHVWKKYAHNLCLLGKLFLPHRTVGRCGLDPFVYYVLTHSDSHGCHIMGYFNIVKEPYAYFHRCTSAVTLPPYKDMGCGKLLADFTYKLFPLDTHLRLLVDESPLSLTGNIFQSHWSETLLDHLVDIEPPRTSGTRPVVTFKASREHPTLAALMSPPLVQTMSDHLQLPHWEELLGLPDSIPVIGSDNLVNGFHSASDEVEHGCAQPVSIEKHIKIGDNTIETSHCADSLAIQLVQDTSAEPNAVRVLSSLRIGTGDHVIWQSDCPGFILTSWIRCASQVGSVQKSATILPFSKEPIPPTAATYLAINWTGGVVWQHLDTSKMTPWMIGKNIDADAFSSSLTPQLYFRANNFNIHLAAEAFTNTVCFDNYALYAKMWYIGLLLDIYCTSEVVPVVQAYPLGQFVAWEDVLQVENQPDATIQALRDGTFFFIEGRSFFRSDWQVLHWLATPGMRVGTQEGLSAHCQYVTWPAIPVRVLGQGPCPAGDVPNVLLDASCIYSFIGRMANDRQEWACCVRGLYVALDLIGVRYTQCAAQSYFIRSTLDVAQPYLACPRDYNFVWRLFSHYPVDSPESRADPVMWMTMPFNERTKVAVLYSAILSTLTTTILTSVNIRLQYLVQWAAGLDVNLNGNSWNFIFSELSFPRSSAGGSAWPLTISESPLISAVKSICQQFFGFTPVSHLYPNSYWNGPYGAQPQAPHCWEGYNMNIPPRLFSVLVVDNWIEKRPLEWGITAPMPKVNFSRELTNGVGPSAITWEASQGSEDYENWIKGQTPFLYIPYGAFGLNVLNQMFKRPNGTYQERRTKWPQWNVSWGHREMVALDRCPFDNQLHVIEPCSVTTYDWLASEVLSPAVSEQLLESPHTLQTVQYISNMPVKNVGMYIRGFCAQPSTALGIMNFSCIPRGGPPGNHPIQAGALAPQQVAGLQHAAGLVNAPPVAAPGEATNMAGVVEGAAAAQENKGGGHPRLSTQ